ncbi:MAG: ATP-binding cassette domain-containing protein, partial [Dehalococcoidia bacterium]|nr:ATP-binding cassette domain-containing protein [Dehalococcoidia bacterium]
MNDEQYIVVADAVSRRFGNVQALLPTTLRIERGETLAVMGPSGCGKTTLINLLGALDRPTAGRVLFRGIPLSYSDRDVTDLHRRDVGFVFQGFALIPSLTAVENVELTLVARGDNPATRRRTAERLMDEVGLGQYHHRFPEEMSGGQRQRVAIARALAHQPALILADEPTGNL